MQSFFISFIVIINSNHCQQYQNSKAQGKERTKSYKVIIDYDFHDWLVDLFGFF